eukprot:7268442-Prymnesium_polylepis.1
MPKQASDALWPRLPDVWKDIGGHSCRLKSSAGGRPPVLYLKDASLKDLKLPAEIGQRASKIAEHMGVQVEDLPAELLAAAGVEPCDVNQAR